MKEIHACPIISMCFSFLSLQSEQMLFQIRFPIGGECVMCVMGQNSKTPQGEKNSITPKENNNLNFQFARYQIVHAYLCTSRPDMKKTPKSRSVSYWRRHSLLKKMIARTYHIINKGENLNILCIQGCPHSATCCPIAVARQENSFVIYNKICCFS